MLKLIDCPTFIVVGDHDTVTPPDCARELHAAIPGSRFLLLPECGHCAPLEYPDLFNDLLEDWLDRHDQSVPAGV